MTITFVCLQFYFKKTQTTFNQRDQGCLITLWYGPIINPKNNNRCVLLRKKKVHLKSKLLHRQLPYGIDLQQHTAYFWIPDQWEFALIEVNSRKIIYMLHKTYFFFLPLPLTINCIHHNSFSRVWVLDSVYFHSFTRVYWFWVKKIFAIFTNMVFKKLRFRAKGYYIFRSRRNTLAFRFNYAHRVYVYISSVSLKFLSKTSILMFGLNIDDINKKALEVKTLRPINIFTGKGVRFTKQIIYRKTGKVSA